MVHEWLIKIIILRCIIHPRVMYENSLARHCTSWYQLVFFISDDYHPFFLRDNMYWSNSWTVRNMIDHLNLKQLKNFFLNHFLHFRIKSSLWLDEWFEFLIKLNLMHAIDWFYPLQIRYVQSKWSIILPQHYHELLFIQTRYIIIDESGLHWLIS